MCWLFNCEEILIMIGQIKIVNVLLKEIFEVLNFSAISRYFLVSSVFENVFQTIFLARIISFLAAILYVSII